MIDHNPNPASNKTKIYLFAILFIISIANIFAGKISNVFTNKSSYSPGELITVNAELREIIPGSKLVVFYFHLNKKLNEQEIIIASGQMLISWNWRAPVEDYKGYLIKIDLYENEVWSSSANIAMDVSSDWKKFPRYGFVSEFPVLPEDSIKSVISNLNRHHINGIQFYDWHYKHHQPLKGTVANPAAYWKDIANRTNYLSTILAYINAAHSVGMKTMAYNLIYGAFSAGYIDGVKDEWGLFRDAQRTQRWGYNLPDNWASDLYFLNPGNEEWKSYIYEAEKKVFQAIPFDGWHADQVGDFGILYDYKGSVVNVDEEFGKFLTDAKSDLNVSIVFNAVNQYGQQSTAKAPVDFLYTEVWDPNNLYSDLIRIVNDNNNFSNNKLSTVFAAYVNQGLAESKNFANTAAVLLADAVIFSSGASHLELGEHYLGNPYFPNKNLIMNKELKKSLISYYDFLVAYENILRDGFETTGLSLEANSEIKLSNVISPGKVYYSTKQKESQYVVHLLNFVGVAHTTWSDPLGNQKSPVRHENFKIKIPVTSKIKSIWYASPDTLLGSPVELDYSEEKGYIEVTVPYLKYWDMIVIETDGGNAESDLTNPNFKLGQNFPNPFNPVTTIPFYCIGGETRLRIFNMIGEEISIKKINASSGANTVKFDGSELASGNYIYSLEYAGQIQSKKMNLLK